MAINPDLLPPVAQELLAEIGLPALLRLVQWRGGRRIYVPHRLYAEHPMVQEIGLQAARQLSDWCPGEPIDVPKCQRAVTDLLNQQIVKRRMAGESEDQVAADIGYCTRSVRRIVARYRSEQPHDDTQGSLF